MDFIIICVLALVVLTMLAYIKKSQEVAYVKVEYDNDCPYELRKSHEDDACYDICIPETVKLMPCSQCLNSGFRIQLPKGFFAMVHPRSGNDLNGMPVTSVINNETKTRRINIDVKTGIVDSGYTGKVGVTIKTNCKMNKGETIYITEGTRVAQLLIQKIPNVIIERVSSIDTETERGEGGFGSTDSVNMPTLNV